MHDENYKRIFASPRVIEDLLRGFVPGAAERALLCRMTASRFGVATAERLAALLAPITDTERLADVGDWLVQCDTGADFLARVDAVPAGGNSDGA